MHPEIQAEIQLKMQAAFEFPGTQKKYACEGLIKPIKGGTFLGLFLPVQASPQDKKVQFTSNFCSSSFC